MLQEFKQLISDERLEVHVSSRSARHRFAGLVARPDHAPDAAVNTIHAFGISLRVLVTGIFVIPVHDPKAAVGTGLRAHGTKPRIAAHEKISGTEMFPFL